jgi:hypothetical protein
LKAHGIICHLKHLAEFAEDNFLGLLHFKLVSFLFKVKGIWWLYGLLRFIDLVSSIQSLSMLGLLFEKMIVQSRICRR